MFPVYLLLDKSRYTNQCNPTACQLQSNPPCSQCAWSDDLIQNISQHNLHDCNISISSSHNRTLSGRSPGRYSARERIQPPSSNLDLVTSSMKVERSKDWNYLEALCPGEQKLLSNSLVDTTQIMDTAEWVGERRPEANTTDESWGGLLGMVGEGAR